MKYYYIHGYGSTGTTTFTGLKNAGLKDLKLVSWTSDKPYEETLEQIKSQIDLDEEAVIIASSFGGFWASHLPYNNYAQIVLVNPLVDPYKSFMEKHYSTTFTEEIAKTYLNRENTILQRSYPITLYLAKDDDVLDYNIADKYYKDYANVKYITGGHVLTNYKEVVEDIKKYENYIAG